MSDFTKEHEKAVMEILTSVTDEQKKQDAQWGLFAVWDYLEEQNIPTHKVAEYIQREGDLLVNKALLMEICGL